MSQINTIKHHGYPSDYVEPEKKFSKEYGLKMIKAIYSEWNQGGLRLQKNRHHEMIRARMYADGDQSTELYKNQILASKNKSWINLNWDIVTIIPKYLDVLMGYFMALKEDPAASAIDELAMEQFREDRAKRMAEIALKDENAIMDAMLGRDPNAMKTQQFQADNFEELDLEMSTTYKQDIEIMMEEGLQLISQHNDLEGETKRKYLWHTLTDGIGGIRRRKDRNGKINVRYVDPLEAIIGFSKRQDFRDIDKAGEFMFLTIGELRLLDVDNQLSEEDLIAIAEQYKGKEGNPRTFDYYNSSNTKFGDFSYDACKVRVLDFEFRTTNFHTYEKTYTGYDGTDPEKEEGQFILNEKPLNYKTNKKGRKVEQDRINVWFKGMWIVGTDYLLDYGPVENQPRDPESLSDAPCGFYFYCPHRKSLVTRMIPFADGIMLKTLRMQHAWAKARPKGVAINLSAIEEVPDGMGGVLRGIQVEALYDQTGNVYYRGDDVDDPDGQRRSIPLQELEGGVGSMIQEGIAGIEHDISMLNNISGINEIMAASLPDPRQPVSTAEMANVQTSKVLNNYYGGWVTSKYWMFNDAAIQLQDMIKSGEVVKGYIEALGSSRMKLVKLQSDVTMHDFGIWIRMRPTEREKMILEQEIQKSLQISDGGGMGIEQEDAIAIRHLMDVSIKAAEQLLVSRRKKRKKEMQQAQQEAAQAKSEADQQTMMAAAQAQAQQLQMQTQAEIAKIEAQAKATLMVEAQLHKYKMEQIALQGQVKNMNIAQQGVNAQNVAATKSE